MYIFFLLFTLLTAEARNVRSVRETTFTRDNTYCQIGKQKIKIQIRSETFLTEQKDKSYGEFIFSYPNNRPKLLPINKDKLSNYRLFRGENSLCSKSYGYALENDKIAVLFLKENRPFKDKLSFQVINTNTLNGEEFVDTEYMSDKTQIAPNGFLFRTHGPRNALEMGTIKIKDVVHTFQDRDFPFWVKYSLAGFEISGPESFQDFQWKSYFKDEKDFFEISGWNETEKKFKNAILYVAVNHNLKKECILLSATKIKVSGDEAGWRCN